MEIIIGILLVLLVIRVLRKVVGILIVVALLAWGADKAGLIEMEKLLAPVAATLKEI